MQGCFCTIENTLPSMNLEKLASPRLVVCISDLHAGSTYAIMPPGFYTKEGNLIGLNKVQEWLWNCWEDSWKWFDELAGDDPWILIVNGDAIDGNHHGTKEIWAVDETDHGSAAYHVLKEPALSAHSMYIVDGTESHTKGHEHSLAYMLKAKNANVVMPDTVAGAWGTLNIEVAGTLCKFDHHISSTSRPYLEASALSIHMGSERVESSRAGHRVPRVFGRAHRHKFGSFDDGHGLMFTTPPWQTLTRFGRKVVPHAIPQCGMVVLDWRHCADDTVPTLHKRLHTIAEASPVQA